MNTVHEGNKLFYTLKCNRRIFCQKKITKKEFLKFIYLCLFLLYWMLFIASVFMAYVFLFSSNSLQTDLPMKDTGSQ